MEVGEEGDVNRNFLRFSVDWCKGVGMGGGGYLQRITRLAHLLITTRTTDTLR